MLVFTVNMEPGGWPAGEVIAFAEARGAKGDVRRAYLAARLAEDENALSRVCEETGAVGESLWGAALTDIQAYLACLAQPDALLDAYRPSAGRRMHFGAYQRSLEAIAGAEGAQAMLESLVSHYRTFGGGPHGKHAAFVWERSLRGIDRPDGIALAGLYCLDAQKRELRENTEAFLQGLPANNVLLYGNSGCGKSSAVKAVLNAYCERGLRLVQVPKEHLTDLPAVMRAIGGRRLRYIVFLDDLSFEGDDPAYKALKTILDGGVEKQPDNVLFYATSNRLHLISESWAERQGDDVHVSDTRNEKLSLAERFGVRLSFLSPGEREYLAILEGILGGAGVSLTEGMQREAVRWAWDCNGLSGRTAQQYANRILAQSKTDAGGGAGCGGGGA